LARLRFSSAQQVIEAFPHLRKELTLQPLELEPFAYLEKLLSSDQPKKALAFCAFLLPRKDAVEWLCRILRKMEATLSASEKALLKLAENWVQSPNENARKAALEAGNADDDKWPACWAALAAGWSGGNLTSDPNHAVPPPIHLTGQAVAVGMSFMITLLPPAEQKKKIEECVRQAAIMLKQG
jgi:hypothetical protein